MAEYESKSGNSKKMKLDPTANYKELTSCRNFMSANGVFSISRENEKYITGIQWDGVKSKNLNKTVYNWVGKIVEIKSASILANELGAKRSAEDIDEGNEHVQSAIQGFNLADKKNWERLEMDRMNEEVVRNGAQAGIGLSYWYWDNDIESGNTVKVQGDIAGQIPDAVNLYCGKPTNVRIQEQPWVKLTVDMTTEELKKYAKEKDVSKANIEKIWPDEQEIAYRGFEKSDYRQEETKDQLATLIVNFKRVKKDGKWKVYKSECTKDVVIEDWKDIELEIYPIAVYVYKPRKKFIYGEAEPTRYIENQKVTNIQIAMRHLHAKMMANPKVLVNENMTGSFNNAIGSVNKVKMGLNQRLTDAMEFKQPAAMTIDVDKSVTDSIEKTMDLAGVNQNIQGSARPENAAALMTQIKQASIPNESYKRRLYAYIEDCLEIWLAFYKTKYNMTRKYKDPETGEIVEMTGTEYADVFVNTRTDVGPSTQWSEITSFQMLMDMWNAGVIQDPKMLLERLPDNSLLDQDGLLSEMSFKDVNNALISQMLPPEMAEQVLQMEPDEQMAAIQQAMQARQPQPPVV